jgi:hypothetical protein|tara:strand:+ start:94 stop:462 length:369 start_codon:yes stop_codon:yes gene_type:complete
MAKKDVDESKIYETTNTLLKGIIIGIFSIYIIIYSLRPSKLNPEFILQIIENKIIFIPLLIINYYLFAWDKTIGILFLIFIISLIFDYLIFIDNNSKKTIKKNMMINLNNYMENFQNYLEKF